MVESALVTPRALALLEATTIFVDRARAPLLLLDLGRESLVATVDLSGLGQSEQTVGSGVVQQLCVGVDEGECSVGVENSHDVLELWQQSTKQDRELVCR